MMRSRALAGALVGAALAAAGAAPAVKEADRIESTQKDIRNIAVAIEAYIIDENSCPNGQRGSIEDLNQPYFTPFYIQTLPKLDGWGNDLRYSQSGAFTKSYSYSVISYGADGVPDEHLYDGPDAGPSIHFASETTDPDADIIFCDGQFTRAPGPK